MKLIFKSESIEGQLEKIMRPVSKQFDQNGKGCTCMPTTKVVQIYIQIPDGAILKSERLRAGFLHVGEQAESLARWQTGNNGNQQ